ncbi:MAG: hypothetical protein OMM_05013 [Candidatus Magnetoglobus multicellularis str. Araruama]|uniref:ATPase domain-containing protein n=1 Tax=Candidatus Magnetoglobus multicellularis str. Araruama TaxID=890399 RepID=A0A1V1NYM1_9BACT|nr:MAG: hypothetical protein OMM_05013 [Candidatus Magnetoglobus multicellularis str. Araruama]
MTKESHLCHVIIASSDGYFLKRIFEDSKLTKTSNFYFVDYLDEADTKYWLNHLEYESAITSFKLTDSQIEFIWKYLGGSMWEISDLLGKLIPCSNNNTISDQHLTDFIHKRIEENCARFSHYAGISNNKIRLLKEIYDLSEKKNFLRILDLKALAEKISYNNNTLSQELEQLVRLNYLAFNPTTSGYQIQGKSMFYGLKQFLESIPDTFY